MKYKKDNFNKKGELKCCRCKLYKSQEDFWSNKRLSGRNFKCSYCILCYGFKPKKKYIRKKEEDLDKFLWALAQGCKNRCNHNKRYKLLGEFNITKEFIKTLYYLQEGKCAISGIPMTYLSGFGKQLRNISLDRIDSKIGYIKGNIRLVCTHVNMMRSNLSDEELFFFCKEIIQNNKL